MVSGLHFYQNGAPGQAASDRSQQKILSCLDATVTDSGINSQRNGCRRRIAVLIDGDNNFFRGNIQLLG